MTDSSAIALPAVAGNDPTPVLIGCAGWSVPGAVQEHFPQQGSHLERYSAVFPAVEINTSFYRPHRPATYARWRDSVPEAFRFSAKVPKAITHELGLRDAHDALQRFIEEVRHLEQKLACLLVQLPPKLRCDMAVAERFFDTLQSLIDVDIVCEPRHPTWFSVEAGDLLSRFRVAYVDADPHPVAAPAPATDAQVVYIRLHGSPVMYYSAYSEEYLDRVHERIKAETGAGKRVWCIFDNTASGAAVPNALALAGRFAQERAKPELG